MSDTQFFFSLTPDHVLNAVEASGFRCTGRCMALNSYENRVYELELDTDEPLLQRRRVAKFYRPGRWTEAQILEEHQFLKDLYQEEVPVVAPLPFSDGRTLHKTAEGDLWYAVFPKVGGRAPDELDTEQLLWLGRLLGRMHNVGASRDAPNRIHLTPETYGISNLEFLLTGNWLPREFRDRYEAAVREICRLAAPAFAEIKPIRIHGDNHLGNLLWGSQGPFFLDFDDMLRGPPVQDFWLLIGGRDDSARMNLELLLEGYETMRPVERGTLRLIEVLRALRFVHYTAWLARRWKDPAFPPAFPHFNSSKYWEEHTVDLEDQLELIVNATAL